MDEYEMKDCIYRKEATEIITKCLEHEGKLQAVERETLIAVKKYLESIPAADVRPVVRGFNVSKDYPSLFECSVCGWSDDDTTTGDTRTYNYCPNCGADMREES